jgi:glutamate synthase domain-containing protein 2
MSHDKPTSFSNVHAFSFVFSRSYHGAQIFEIYGLGEEVVDTAFRGSTSRIAGLTMNEVRTLLDFRSILNYFFNN